MSNIKVSISKRIQYSHSAPTKTPRPVKNIIEKKVKFPVSFFLVLNAQIELYPFKFDLNRLVTLQILGFAPTLLEIFSDNQKS